MAQPIPLPKYGVRSLGELIPALLGSLAIAGFPNALHLEPTARACLLLVDGLGWEGLRANSAIAPFLNSIAQAPLTAGFPATTAASLTSVATGLTPGEHGMVGYTMAMPGYDRALNALTWSLYGIGPRTDLRDQVPPETFQPGRTLGEAAALGGLTIHHLGPGFHAGSGLTRAIGRGERFHPADSLESLTETAARLLEGSARLVYGYHSGLDAAGHVNGVASEQWRGELGNIDNAVRMLAEQLRPGTLLVVTGDHGMVDLRPDQRLDLADYPELASGVQVLAGEARARYIRAEPGAANDVIDVWRAILGDRMWIWSREEAIASGIFGASLSDRARERIGDVVAAAFDSVGVFQREVDPAQARFNGHHGSLTPAEHLVPFLVYRA
ncbi:MAG TPA: alkaline phosphatase family protein [Candidatus Dormibacteraeota bacterium]